MTIGNVVTTDPTFGGNDTITTGAGNDLILAGTGADTVRAGAGNDLVFGDFGTLGGLVDAAQLPLNNVAPFTFTSIFTDNLSGGAGDVIYGEDGDDIVLGGQGDD